MSNNLVLRIELVSINNDGTIKIIDTLSWCEYPIDYQYKLYLSRIENMQNMLEVLFDTPPKDYELSDRLLKYIENRESYYNEVSLKYWPLINTINNSLLSKQSKKDLIQKIDLELNSLYPYA